MFLSGSNNSIEVWLVHGGNVYIGLKCGTVYQCNEWGIKQFHDGGECRPIGLAVLNDILWVVYDSLYYYCWNISDTGKSYTRTGILKYSVKSIIGDKISFHMATWKERIVYLEVDNSPECIPECIRFVTVNVDGAVEYYYPGPDRHYLIQLISSWNRTLTLSKQIIWKGLYYISCDNGAVLVMEDFCTVAKTLPKIYRKGRLCIGEVSAMDTSENFLYVAYCDPIVSKWTEGGDLVYIIDISNAYIHTRFTALQHEIVVTDTLGPMRTQTKDTFLFGDLHILKVIYTCGDQLLSKADLEFVNSHEQMILHSPTQFFRWKGGLFGVLATSVRQWTYTKPWSTANHMSYCKQIRQVVKTLLLLSNTNRLPHRIFPRDLIYYIIALAVGTIPFANISEITNK